MKPLRQMFFCYLLVIKLGGFWEVFPPQHIGYQSKCVRLFFSAQNQGIYHNRAIR